MMVLFGQSSGPVPPLEPQILNTRGSIFLTRPSLAHYLLSREELLARGRRIRRDRTRGARAEDRSRVSTGRRCRRIEHWSRAQPPASSSSRRVSFLHQTRGSSDTTIMTTLRTALLIGFVAATTSTFAQTRLHKLRLRRRRRRRARRRLRRAPPTRRHRYRQRRRWRFTPRTRAAMAFRGSRWRSPARSSAQD